MPKPDVSAKTSTETTEANALTATDTTATSATTTETKATGDTTTETKPSSGATTDTKPASDATDTKDASANADTTTDTKDASATATTTTTEGFDDPDPDLYYKANNPDVYAKEASTIATATHFISMTGHFKGAIEMLVNKTKNSVDVIKKTKLTTKDLKDGKITPAYLDKK
jgi:hypothetical protein